MGFNDLKDYEVYALVLSGNMSEEEFLTYICNLHIESYDSGYDKGYSEGYSEGYTDCHENNSWRYEQ